MTDDTTKSLARRKLSRPKGDVIKAGAIEMDVVRRKVWIENQPVKLAWKDFELLKILLEAKGEVIHRQSLLEKIWGHENLSGSASRTVDVHILRLRNKLGAEGHRILTVRNVGYRFDVCLEWIRFGS